jgi:AmmeMemoRadiSam system protein B
MTPLGKVALDHDLIRELMTADGDLALDSRAHAAEHSLEVQVPFLQTLRPDVRLAPIVVGTHDLQALLRLGQALAEVAARLPERPLIVISSDMTHYEPAEAARAKDARALAWLSVVDPVGLYKTVTEQGITMCGVAPAVAALEALRRLGATRGEQVVYTHSGVVTGNDREVVAYAGVVFRA